MTTPEHLPPLLPAIPGHHPCGGGWPGPAVLRWNLAASFEETPGEGDMAPDLAAIPSLTYDLPWSNCTSNVPLTPGIRHNFTSVGFSTSGFSSN
ncbi:hypothetical protein F2Q70_00043538 [Brassica cretica]|uniref:Uncharacterized protein n=1 Tax=Brassica cretica TaxID=69181 RepID=A0A8S9KJJ6_BRACR|nr:hypothetical protein F2Q70_00043538 [Brassica cretica]